MKQFLHYQLALTHQTLNYSNSQRTVLNIQQRLPSSTSVCCAQTSEASGSPLDLGNMSRWERRVLYQGDMTSSEQPAPRQYTSPVCQPSAFLDVDSVQLAKTYLPMSSQYASYNKGFDYGRLISIFSIFLLQDLPVEGPRPRRHNKYVCCKHTVIEIYLISLLWNKA